MLERVWRSLIRFGFFLFYNPFAFTYDVVSWLVSRGQWKDWQRVALVFANTTGVILDLAHGTGTIQVDLARRQVPCVGFDLSRQMGRIARKKLLREGLPLRLVRGRAQQLPFSDGAFSSIVCTFPSEFIFHHATLNECARVLQPAGRLVIVLTATLADDGLFSRLIAFAYHITGQTAASASAQMMDEMRHMTFILMAPHGFAIEVESVPVQSSRVIVVIATKRDWTGSPEPATVSTQDGGYSSVG